MTFLFRNRAWCPLLICLALAAAAFAETGERKARVAGGEEVTLADSQYSAKQLAAMRPGYRALIPKIR